MNENYNAFWCPMCGQEYQHPDDCCPACGMGKVDYRYQRNQLINFIQDRNARIAELENDIALNCEPMAEWQKNKFEHEINLLQARIAELESCNEWISVEEKLPTAQRRVMALYTNEAGKFRYELAVFIPAKSVLSEDFLNDDFNDGAQEYDDENDCYWVVEGWWEDSWESETNWKISNTVTHWRPLPPAPHKHDPELEICPEDGLLKMRCKDCGKVVMETDMGESE